LKLFVLDARVEYVMDKGSLVTADRHEIELIEIADKINITWFI